MHFHLRKTCLAAFLILAVSPVIAMQPCREPDGCIDEASAMVIAPLDVYVQRCSRENPKHEQAYKDLVQYIFRQEDQRFLERLRASTVYGAVRLRLEQQFDQIDHKTLILQCDVALQEKRS